MANFEIEHTRLASGVWEGVLRDASGSGRAPEIEVMHREQPIAHELQEAPDAPGQWLLRVPVPPETLNDGVQVFLISDRESGAQLAAFVLQGGEPPEEDIRAELALLRAELDMLKKAFRRHCRESG